MRASPLAPGSNLDRYAVEALIGRGGMGEVYRAVDTRLRRKVALKVLRPDTDDQNPDGVARLFREARAAAALSHPNTVAIHDIGESEGLFYLVMELVIGQPLMAYVGDERVSLARRLKWLAEIARALATAHKAGVIHRDVKPSNVMVTEDDVAKVLDFGLAKPMPKAGGEPESFGFKTQAGRVLGTVRYMAPEQMIGSEADGRSDQYSLGMTAYELLAGRYPPGKPFEIPPLLNTVVPGFPADGALAIARMLKRIPEDRFNSMDDVATAFDDMGANRPVRALGIAPGPKPARRAVVVEEVLNDKTKLDPPGKHGIGPETVPDHHVVGSTLTSVEDERSADAVLAAEEALQPTVSPSELANLEMAQTVLPSQPKPDADDDGGDGASPDSQAPDSPKSRTLQSADAGDRVREAREAMSKMLQEPDKKPGSKQPASKTQKGPVATTLASGGASPAVLEVRKATPAKPIRVESAPPPKPATEEKQTAELARVEKETPKKPNVLLIVLTIAFLALAAFAGNYFGARSRRE